MSESVHPLAFRRRPVWLLALGLLAMALHMLAGSGLLRAAADGGDSFVAAVCTSHGLIQASSAPAAGDSSAPAAGVHDCCKLCAASAQLLAANDAAAVPPAPTFIARQRFPAFAPPTPAVRTAHAPRGPPAPA